MSCPVWVSERPGGQNHLLIDEETAPIVAADFRICPKRSWSELYPQTAGGRKIPCPHMVEPGNGASAIPAPNGKKKDPENGRYMWDFSVIKDLLMNPVYTGAIASPEKDYRFKIGTIGESSRRTGLWWRVARTAD